MKRHRIAFVAAGFVTAGLAAVAVGSGVSTAGADSTPTQHALTEKATGAGALKAVAGVVNCDAGKSLKLYARFSANPFSFVGTSNAFVAVPGAQVSVPGPATGTDTLLVTFSAESYYTGTGWMGLQVEKNGVPIKPFADNGSPFAFASTAKYGSNSAQFCTRITKGTNIISVKVATTGAAGTDSGWIDDWGLSVQRFE